MHIKIHALRLILFLLFTPSAFADLSESQSAKVLGSSIGASVDANAPSSTGQLNSATRLDVLGNSMQALSTSITPSETIDGTSYAEYSSFGKNVLSKSFQFSHNGVLDASVGLAPTEIRVPVVVYPVGPLVLEIAAGARFEADVSAQLLPMIMIGAADQSTLTVNVNGNADASGFIEGYSSLIALRGGVGGDVELVGGQINMNADFRFNGSDPTVQYGALLTFLNGELYAFADIFNPTSFSWDRFWQTNLYSWTSYCYAAGALACPAK
jgi:hypothetical protein